MAKLAIKGHPKRGNEVIEILEMLGGINKEEYNGENNRLWYSIDERNEISFFTHAFDLNDYFFFTIEEFLEKFPYKVGDKVLINDDINDVYTITSMTWDEDRVAYRIEAIDGIDDPHYWFANEMMHYTEQKEETMEGKIESFEILESHCADEVKIEFDPSKFEMVERDNGYYVVKKQLKYPTTYEECCEILEVESEFTINDLTVNEKDFLKSIIKLKECREAYWIIAGFWKPDFTNKEQKKFTISFIEDEIYFSGTYVRNSFLVFPTAETRDAFYENFKDLINEVKELL